MGFFRLRQRAHGGCDRSAEDANSSLARGPTSIFSEVTREMETDRQSLVYPVRKQTTLREKKKFPRSDHRFMFFCLFIINLLTVAALLMIYHSNQYLNELTVITQNLKSDVENTANLHRLLLTKLQESDRRDKLVDVLKTFNSTSNKTRMNLSVRN